MDSATEIDLYDNIEEDFVQDSNDLTELYDDVVTPSSSKPDSLASDSRVKTIISTPPPTHSGKRFATYLGNLTWWTTDSDIVEAFGSLGIRDILEVKFHENRQNGQSKGFCVVVLGSEASVKLGMDRIPKIEINGQQPVLTNCTKHNLNIFEKVANNEGNGAGSPAGSGLLGSATTFSNNRGGVSSNGRLPPPLMSTPALPANLGFSMRGSTSLMGRASTSSRTQSGGVATGLGIPNISQGIQNLLMTGLNLQGNLQANQASGLMQAPGLNLPGVSSTTTHINPNFLQQGALNQANAGGQNSLLQAAQLNASGIHPQIDQFGRPIVQTYTPGQFRPSKTFLSYAGKLGDAEFEDILQKNKTVSSIAINRAVQDAACGNYASAIETLVTAISLIKQSKISSDDRCKILINSLQDTLHGIESKSYGSKGSSSRRRRRSYSNSGSDGVGGDGYNSSSSRRHLDREHRGDRHRSRSRSPGRGDRRGGGADYDRRGTYHRSSRSGARSGDRDYYGGGSGGSPSYRESGNRYRQ